jgi:hypothetical protein
MGYSERETRDVHPPRSTCIDVHGVAKLRVCQHIRCMVKMKEGIGWPRKDTAIGHTVREER